MIAVPARAQPPEADQAPADEPRPWAAGVSADKQAEAQELVETGRDLFAQGQYTEALHKYRQAQQAWDHPVIRFNIAVCMIELDRPVDAYEHLTQALRYGEAPLGAKLYADGQTYRKLLLGRLAEVKVMCEEPGAKVTLDGTELLKGPGEATRLLLPGAHQVVASKPGFYTRTVSVSLPSGKLTPVKVELLSFDAAIRKERRWKRWKPWAVVGAGAAVALVGLPLRLLAESNVAQYEQEIGELCPDGCMPDDLPRSTRDLKSRAKWQDASAGVFFAAGGATVLTGLVLAILNRERTVRPTDPNQEPPGKVTVSPMLGPDRAGVTTGFSF